MARFVLQRVSDRRLFADTNRWVSHPIGARWFGSVEEGMAMAVRVRLGVVRRLNESCTDILPVSPHQQQEVA